MFAKVEPSRGKSVDPRVNKPKLQVLTLYVLMNSLTTENDSQHLCG